MGVFKKKASPVSSAPEQSVVVGKAAPKKYGLPKRVVIIILVLILSGAIGGYLLWDKMNSKVKQGNENTSSVIDKEKAYAGAKKYVEKSPDDLDTLLSAAEYARDVNPEEAKQYYAKALEVYKKENKFDDDSVKKTAINYNAAAGLAEQADNTVEAIKYYELVIKTADLSDAYQKNIAEKSNVALERLE